MFHAKLVGMSRKTLKNQNGFTLIEIMICVAILGILVAVAVPQYQRFTSTARRSEGYAFLRMIYTAEAVYYAAQDTYTLDPVRLWLDGNENLFQSLPKNYLFYTPTFLSDDKNRGFGVGIWGNIDTDPSMDLLALVVGTPNNYFTGYDNGIHILEDDVQN